jgi:transcriptional regulator with GAF, ATPase, and Fis domain
VATWPDILWALNYYQGLGQAQAVDPSPRERSKLTYIRLKGEDLIRVKFRRGGPNGSEQVFTCWILLDNIPIEELIPSVLWLGLKLMLFLVGALVFWKRPADRSAAQFFLLCVVTLGAYMGGYHWSRIATQPVLIVVFMICAVLLPVVSLHFYLIFPRPKGFLQRHPRSTLLAIYGPTAGLILVLLASYLRVRWLYRGQAPATDVAAALDQLRALIYFAMGVAALWYLASVVCLVHSYRTVSDATERNQVKWILSGSLVALVPIGYTLYLAVWWPSHFGAGAAAWPMFAASVFFTVAFAVSITRYRLMQLDQIVSSGVMYFMISFLAGLGYYAVVFAGMVVVGSRVIGGPSLSQALWVSTTALVLLIVHDVVRGRLKKALDRRFYREKYQLDHTLRRMSQAIEQLVDPPTLARRLLQASAELLGVSRGAVYLREGSPPLYRLAGCLGPGAPPLTELSSGCPLVEAVQARGTLAVRHGAETDPPQRQLRLLGGEIAHPLAHEGHLLALLVLGPKDLGTFGAEDLNLLSAFAQLTALALESAAGHRTIEALNRELQAKVEKISEQQRRILALQSQLMKWEARGAERGAELENGMGADSASLLDARATTRDVPGGIVGSGAAVRHLLHLVRKVSASQSVVLLRGESGTGKELLARALHDSSPRAKKPFIKVHCAALSEGLLESELFGHVKGAFTGAHRDKIGRFELANGGSLFLDEIGDISLNTQTKLLRVLQEMTFERVGSSEPLQVDVRVIAATHQNLEQLIHDGRFREDLYYRLNVISIRVPPLRDRREDIAELALHFLRLYAQRCGKAVAQVDDDALAVLKGYAWPGNIRELENVLERAVVLAEGPAVTVHELPPELVRAVGSEASTPDWSKTDNPGDEIPAKGLKAERLERDRREREQLVRALAAAGGNKAQAARALGLARSTLVSRLNKHGLS